MRVLRLLEVHRARECIVVTCGLDDLRFHFTVWYEDVDLHALAVVHGDELMERLAVHVALFQMNTVASLKPDVIELGAYARHATPRLVELWRVVFRHVWAQWRWEHDLPDYVGPTFTDVSAGALSPGPVRSFEGPVPWLVFCGGGKDSLVALKLFERARLPFATLAYSHSVYGDRALQHALIDRVGAATARARAERQWVVDDFLDAPSLELRPSLGVRSLLAAETPASVFAALPVALARGYRGLVVAHERGASTGNFFWDKAEEEVNHQWGKSWEAEQLLDDYIHTELLSDVRYFSVLQPIHDEVIFELLVQDPEQAALTHSCNVRKPWCGACAKCAYVWLQMAAHLPAPLVDAMFGGDLGERPDNGRWFRALLGLAEHTPFECVGTVAEARLALGLLRRRRSLGPQLAALAAQIELDVNALAEPLLVVGDRHGMPAAVAAKIVPQLEAASASARLKLGR